MIGHLIGSTLPLAVGVAISPVPIIGIILVLFTKRAKANSLFYVMGWFIGLVVAGAIFVALSSLQSVASGKGGSPAGAIVNILLGALLLYLAFKAWNDRPKKGEKPKMPAWMSTLDTVGVAQIFVIAFLLATLNAKNAALWVTVALDISKAGLTIGGIVIMILFFCVFGSLLVAIPAAAYLISGKKMEAVLKTWREWLVEHNTAVMMTIFLVFGAMIAGKGISALFAVA